MNILIWLICGIVAGWLTGLIMKGGGYGLIGDLVIGLLGGLVAGLGGVILVALLRLLRRV